MPSAPEFGNTCRKIGIIEILREFKTKDPAETDSHIAVAGEIEIDLQGEGNGIDPDKKYRSVTGFSEEDLQLLWQAILNMFEDDHSAARGKMAVRELIVFKHESELGNAPAYKLFESVSVERRSDVAIPRGYGDYVVSVSDALPEGVSCERMS